jgi:hypothetical protein
VQLLTSDEGLLANWARLDAFDGEGYVRMLVPLANPGGEVVVANLCAMAPNAANALQES